MSRGKDCDACEGTGLVEVDVADWRGEHRSEVVPCDCCGGSGQVHDEDDGDGLDLDPYADRDVVLNAEVVWESPL